MKKYVYAVGLWKIGMAGYDFATSFHN
jgi:hypothetical protein